MLAVAEEDPAPDETDSESKHDEPADEGQPFEMRNDGIIAEIGKIFERGAFHLQKTVTGYDSGNDKNKNSNKPGYDHSHGVLSLIRPKLGYIPDKVA